MDLQEFLALAKAMDEATRVVGGFEKMVLDPFEGLKMEDVFRGERNRREKKQEVIEDEGCDCPECVAKRGG